MQDPTPRTGDFALKDDISGTLLPILARMMREQLPVLADTSRILTEWLREHPGEPVPRALGMHAFTLESRSGQRIVRPYSLWMLQRARTFYSSLRGPDLAAADRLLDAIGGEMFQAFRDPPRLARDGMSIKLESTR